jgi:hypothetical protein
MVFSLIIDENFLSSYVRNTLQRTNITFLKIVPVVFRTSLFPRYGTFHPIWGHEGP